MTLIEIFKALGDENRLKILQMLKKEELCVCEVIEELQHLTQPTISHHLKILKQAGLVKDRRDGKWIYYSINKAVLLEVKDFITKLTEPEMDCKQNGIKRKPKCEW